MRDLTQGREGKSILFFAIPMLIGNFFQIFNTLVDSIVVGNYIGKEALAAIGTSFPVIFALISLVIGVSGGISIVISQYFGAKDLDKVKKSIDTAFIFLMGSSLVVAVIGIALAPNIFSALQLSEEVIPVATTYMRIYLSGLIFTAGYNGAMAILRGLGDSKTPLYFLIITSITNIILELILIVVFKMGIQGAAIATVGSQVFGFFVSIIYLNRTHSLFDVRLTSMKFDMNIFSQSLRIGLPSGMQQVFVAMGMVALLRIVNRFGTDAMAAYTIAGRIDSFASLPAMNFAMALSAFTGQNIGAGKFDRVSNGLKSTLFMTSVIVVIMSVFVFLFSHSLMGMFTKDLEVISIGTSYLKIVSAFYLMFSMMFAYTGVTRGAGDTLVPMFITLFSLWIIRIPVAWFLSARIGVEGIWWAIPIAWTMGMVASYAYYKTGRWKTKSVVGNNIEL
ncbi:MAG: MATE family efflux transporter [Bacteroidales bacterium]|jgi:putative MATE family efflux protein|nr:MATE family efflux transporter [Bacteroidales bacterium]